MHRKFFAFNDSAKALIVHTVFGLYVMREILVRVFVYRTMEYTCLV